MAGPRFPAESPAEIPADSPSKEAPRLSGGRSVEEAAKAKASGEGGGRCVEEESSVLARMLGGVERGEGALGS